VCHNVQEDSLEHVSLEECYILHCIDCSCKTQKWSPLVQEDSGNQEVFSVNVMCKRTHHNTFDCIENALTDVLYNDQIFCTYSAGL
jgi:hypothetical protein